uniref:NAD(P)H-quinone oxidoreductase n=1 Tax=Desulfacinum infernum TaxID=35837 RepID=A0A831ZRG6_9BACT
MPAVVVRKTDDPGGWNALELDQVPIPEPQPGEVLVQVEAFSVNRADLLQRRGLYPPPPGASPILGLDLAGYVIRRGSEDLPWHEGDRVFGITAGGGYARYATVRADHLMPVPENLSFVEAAAAAEVFVVAYINIFEEAGAQAGETLLVHGGGSGVGTAAIQLAKACALAVATTCGSESKAERCRALGADLVINRTREDFADAVLSWTDGRGVDVILDFVGAPYVEKHLKILAPQGRLVLIGLMGGHQASFSLAPVLTQRIRIIGSVLRSRSDAEKAALIARCRANLLPLLEKGVVRPVVDTIFAVSDVEAAHLYVREGKHFGKVVVRWKE